MSYPLSLVFSACGSLSQVSRENREKKKEKENWCASDKWTVITRNDIETVQLKMMKNEEREKKTPATGSLVNGLRDKWKSDKWTEIVYARDTHSHADDIVFRLICEGEEETRE